MKGQLEINSSMKIWKAKEIINLIEGDGGFLQGKKEATNITGIRQNKER